MLLNSTFSIVLRASLHASIHPLKAPVREHT
jgi:hypothetical protein